MAEQQQGPRLELRRASWSSALRSRHAARVAMPEDSAPCVIHQAPLRERKRVPKQVRVMLPFHRSVRRSLKSMQDPRPATSNPCQTRTDFPKQLHKVTMSITEFKSPQSNYFQAMRHPRNPTFFQSKEDRPPRVSPKALQPEFEMPCTTTNSFCKEPTKKQFAYEGYTQRGRSFGSPFKSFRGLRYREYLL